MSKYALYHTITMSQFLEAKFRNREFMSFLYGLSILKQLCVQF